jgi:hypothetical protein
MRRLARALEAEMRRADPRGDHTRGYGTVVSWRRGGNDPLDYVATYRMNEPLPHWM